MNRDDVLTAAFVNEDIERYPLTLRITGIEVKDDNSNPDFNPRILIGFTSTDYYYENMEILGVSIYTYCCVCTFYIRNNDIC